MQNAQRTLRLIALVVIFAASLPLSSASAQVAPAGLRVGDPDTAAITLNGLQQYITVSTSHHTANASSPPCPQQLFNMPYIIHGSGSDFNLSGECADGELLPNPGTWIGAQATLSPGAYWGGSILQASNGKWYLYFTGQNADPAFQSRCVWGVVANSLEGLKSAPRRLFKCSNHQSYDNTNRDVLAADVFEHQGQVYLSYRDDSYASGVWNTSLVVSRVNANNGSLVNGTTRVLLQSTSVAWSEFVAMTLPGNPTRRIIENPDMVLNPSNGRWYVYFSGNIFSSQDYATGIADCGTNLLQGGHCQPIASGGTRAYFGGPGAQPAPFKMLPDNRHGPGHMSIFPTHGGGYGASWASWEGRSPYEHEPETTSNQRRVILSETHSLSVGTSNDFNIPAKRCVGLDVTVDLSLGQTPTNNDDVILGTSGPDIINGLGGNDTICSLDGDDRVDGGDGDDRIEAGRGNDLLWGRAGNDHLSGGFGSDEIHGGNGSDLIYGGPQNDLIKGNFGNDLLYGQNGNDTIFGGFNNDVISGGSGSDHCVDTKGSNTINGCET